jgi:hypothetical protein
LWHKAKRKNTELLWGQFRLLRNQVKTLLRSKHNNYVSSLGDICKNNPKRFWSYFKRVTKSRCIPGHITNGQLVNEKPLEKATMFNDYFCSIFLESTVLQTPFVHLSPGATPVTLPVFTPKQVLDVMKKSRCK